MYCPLSSIYSCPLPGNSIFYPLTIIPLQEKARKFKHVSLPIPYLSLIPYLVYLVPYLLSPTLHHMSPIPYVVILSPISPFPLLEKARKFKHVPLPTPYLFSPAWYILSRVPYPLSPILCLLSPVPAVSASAACGNAVAAPSLLVLSCYTVGAV